jgi:hypothetical protein
MWDGAVGGRSMARTFPSAGTYTVTCSVIVNGRNSSITQPITVEGGAPVSDLLLDRFSVDVEWQNHSGTTGSGKRIPCPELGNQTFLYWFFSETNMELAIKAIDGGDKFWIFISGLTDVQVLITITDTVTGAVRSYRNEMGTAFQPVQDTSAFPKN